MTPLRILVAHNVSCGRPGGMSRLMSLIHQRAEREGHEVSYLCAEDAGAAGRGPLARFRFPLLVARRVKDAARRGRPYDIVNVHEPVSAVVASFRSHPGPAIVVTTHGVERRAWELALEEGRRGRGGPSWKTRLWYPASSLWQSTVGLRKADHVFCLNLQDRDYLVGRFGIPNDRITPIQPGADPLFAGAAATRDYTRAHRLLFAGTWRKNKGIDDFIPAFTALAEKWPPLELTVAGAGVPQDTVRAAFPAAVRSRVHTVQTSTDAETAAVYAEADVYVLPSLFEGTPLTLMESMMSGLPIVTTDTCGMKDVIVHDRTGLLIPLRSPGAIVAAVERLLNSPADRERLGRAARADAVEHHTWDHAAAPVLRVYRHLAEREQ